MQVDSWEMSAWAEEPAGAEALRQKHAGIYAESREACVVR